MSEETLQVSSTAGGGGVPSSATDRTLSYIHRAHHSNDSTDPSLHSVYQPLNHPQDESTIYSGLGGKSSMITSTTTSTAAMAGQAAGTGRRNSISTYLSQVSLSDSSSTVTPVNGSRSSSVASSAANTLVIKSSGNNTLQQPLYHHYHQGAATVPTTAGQTQEQEHECANTTTTMDVLHQAGATGSYLTSNSHPPTAIPSTGPNNISSLLLTSSTLPPTSHHSSPPIATSLSQSISIANYHHHHPSNHHNHLNLHLNHPHHHHQNHSSGANNMNTTIYVHGRVNPQQEYYPQARNSTTVAAAVATVAHESPYANPHTLAHQSTTTTSLNSSSTSSVPSTSHGAAQYHMSMGSAERVDSGPTGGCCPAGGAQRGSTSSGTSSSSSATPDTFGTPSGSPLKPTDGSGLSLATSADSGIDIQQGPAHNQQMYHQQQNAQHPHHPQQQQQQQQQQQAAAASMAAQSSSGQQNSRTHIGYMNLDQYRSIAVGSIMGGLSPQLSHLDPSLLTAETLSQIYAVHSAGAASPVAAAAAGGQAATASPSSSGSNLSGNSQRNSVDQPGTPSHTNRSSTTSLNSDSYRDARGSAHGSRENFHQAGSRPGSHGGSQNSVVEANSRYANLNEALVASHRGHSANSQSPQAAPHHHPHHHPQQPQQQQHHAHHPHHPQASPEAAAAAAVAERLTLERENLVWRSQVETLRLKVLKLEKMEQELRRVASDYAVLIKSSEKKEQLEEKLREQLEADLRAREAENGLLREQLSAALAHIAKWNETRDGQEENDLRREIGARDALIGQLLTQNRELEAQRDRYEAEISAQELTLKEQRSHIEILDLALVSAQTELADSHQDKDKKEREREREMERAHFHI